jgi:hypothetical protein
MAEPGHRQRQHCQRRQQRAGIIFDAGEEIAGGYNGRRDPAAEFQGGERHVVRASVLRTSDFELTGITDRSKVHFLAVDHVVGQRQQRIGGSELPEHRHLAEPLLGNRRLVGGGDDMSVAIDDDHGSALADLQPLEKARQPLELDDDIDDADAF